MSRNGQKLEVTGLAIASLARITGYGAVFVARAVAQIWQTQSKRSIRSQLVDRRPAEA